MNHNEIMRATQTLGVNIFALLQASNQNVLAGSDEDKEHKQKAANALFGGLELLGQFLTDVNRIADNIDTLRLLEEDRRIDELHDRQKAL